MQLFIVLNDYIKGYLRVGIKTTAVKLRADYLSIPFTIMVPYMPYS